MVKGKVGEQGKEKFQLSGMKAYDPYFTFYLKKGVLTTNLNYKRFNNTNVVYIINNFLGGKRHFLT